MNDKKLKKKKHKKHKKSKKSAITLDQFLNMNADVFGEGLDFQGVEEVPSQTIAKRLKKPAKKIAQSKLPPDIEKLKRQGIVIKKKTGTSTVIPLVVKNKDTIPTFNPVTQTNPSVLATPHDVLTKLINQNNSQIKIVKKSSLETKSTNTNEMPHAIPAVDNKVPIEDTVSNRTNFTLPIPKETNENITEDYTETDNPGSDNDTNANNTAGKSTNLENKSLTDPESNDDEESNHSQSILDEINETAEVSQTGKDTIVSDQLTALRNSSNNAMKSSQQSVPSVNTIKETDISHEREENTSNREEDFDPDTNGERMESDRNDSLNALKHLSHLIVKSCSQEKKPSAKLDNVQGVDTKVEQSEVGKIAHLIRYSPAKVVTNTVKNPTLESEDHSDTDDEHNDKLITEPLQSDKLVSILNSPHLNIQTIKNIPPKVMSQKESPTESLLNRNEKSSADLLKHLKNVTAKPVGVNKTVNISTLSPKLSPKLINTIKMEPLATPVKHSKVIQEDIEIFNIDDSDSDEANSNTAHVNKSESKETPAANKSADALKNMNKNITIKSVNNKVINNSKVPIKVLDRVQIKEFVSDDDDGGDDESHGALLPNNSRNTKFSSPQINQKQTALNNVLKNLSKNITVKSGNASPAHFSVSEDQKSRDSSFAPDDEGVDSETESLSGRVKITEMNDGSDDDFHKDHTDTNDCVQDNVKVQYPDESNSDNEERNDDEEFGDNFSDEDIEKHIPANAVKNNPTSKPNLDSLKNVSKDLVIKPSGQTMNRTSDEIPPFAKSLSNRISIKNMKQTDNCNKQINTNSFNPRNAEQSIGNSMSKSAINQKMASSSNQLNSVNKTVKTFKTQTQTKTVIQEITTTVTKTIKTVNQSMKQEIKNMGQSSSTPQKIRQQNPNHKNFQGIKVRQTAPMAPPRLRNPGMRPTRPVLATPLRASNQLVPARPRLNAPRQIIPRMPFVRPSTSGLPRSQIGCASVKLAPGVTTSAKRPNTDAPGHFSCFKKTKESLFPDADSVGNVNEGETSVQFSSTMQMSKSNFASTTKVAKGNSVVTSSHMKTEMSASSQQLGKLRNLSGLSVVKTSQANQSQIEEKSEMSSANQNTLDAIQKLQSQGLLVKKPRLVSEESEHSNTDSDMEHFSGEEFGM